MISFQVIQRLRRRLRIHCSCERFTDEQAEMIEQFLLGSNAISSVKIMSRIGDIVIIHNGDEESVKEVIKGINELDLAHAPALSPLSTRKINRSYKEQLILNTVTYVAKKIVLPLPVQAIWAWGSAFKFIKKAIVLAWQRKLNVDLLDGVALGVSLLRRDYSTVGAVIYLLGVGDLLEQWTHKKAVLDLAQSMSLNVDKVWVKIDNTEVNKPIGEVQEGDLIVLRQSDVIPLDGIVTEGLVMVNQSSMTGESVPVEKETDDYLYAGTVVEEGECIFAVKGTSKTTRYEQIVSMIEESEQMKSEMETRAYAIADKLVPYSFIGTLLTYALTQNFQKALSFLMVDFSCALKLSTPLAILSAMQEASKHGITVKGGKFLERISKADTIIFDKTGTLTKAEPVFKEIITFGDNDPADMLTLAACLEEHFPHSMANAVVRAAEKHRLPHKELHSKIEYIVAHGIASRVNRRRCRIGSAHFIFDDEKTVIPEGEQEKFDSISNEYSHLYMAIQGRLVAVICIEDPVREEAKEVISELRTLGISKIVMMTGDSKLNAERVAKLIGVDEVHSGVLPSDKADFVKAERAAGRSVVMVGDGINDSPALSAADVGIAMNEGAAIAQRIADVTISSNHLEALVVLRRISMALMKRISLDHKAIMGFNGALIAGGLTGTIQPAAAAWLHNTFTVGVSLHSLMPVLNEKKYNQVEEPIEHLAIEAAQA